MPFEIVKPAATSGNPLDAEEALLAHAAAGRAVAHLWEAPVSLVVPRSYQRYATLDAARDAFAQRGCPVWLRLSGGGLVPQGPGILNLSLAYPLAGTIGTMADAVYLHLCAILAGALHGLGIETNWREVEGSFCDGRFNLAWGPAGDARKIAGTAQYWRRVPQAAGTRDEPLYAVLAHAVLLVDADPLEINRRANDFESLIGSGRHYEADKVVSVADALGRQGTSDDADLRARVARALEAAVVAASPPRVPST
ncbi:MULTISPECIES: lipoyl protein ligase domain-containing protein [unclassified Caballeronia]|uniref:lipoyl protein ligase domain-containing protein n=1 Tax=unclassified Caballeronia TaxID=2646786 RepID=UPI00285BFAEB|nr:MULTISPECIES: lipoate--protein ligase family protein [unclassified Caballeronia]MDR5753370.1 lipoate--protein ligase family protein [Caballeronia sp. LZ024]MDR5841109.1 lipoate--protein ligase family protein [Caballeronia sp. LZ031]